MLKKIKKFLHKIYQNKSPDVFLFLLGYFAITTVFFILIYTTYSVFPLIGLIVAYVVFSIWFWRRTNIVWYVKVLSSIATIILSIVVGFITFVAIFWWPGEKEHDKIMYEICLPAMRKYYGIKLGDSFPITPTDKYGNAKWWYQHEECEDNVEKGKGPKFSDNPSIFHPLSK